MCRLVSTIVPDGPSPSVSGNALAKVVIRCEQHGWTFDGYGKHLCPIGKIEKATDDALAKIAEASRK